MSQTEKLPDPKQETPSRTTRIVQLRVRGMTDEATAAQLRSEGYLKCGQKTVSRTWVKIRKEHNEGFVEELQRQQLADITMADSREVKLKYRDKLLERLMPRQTQPLAITGPVAPLFEIGLKDVDAKPPDELPAP